MQPSWKRSGNALDVAVLRVLDDAIEVAQRLPHRLGEGERNGVPLVGARARIRS